MKTKKGLTSTIVTLVLLVLLTGKAIRTNNHITALQADISQARTQVVEQSQHRQALIPDLLKQVEVYTQLDSSPLLQATPTEADTPATPEAMQEYLAAQRQLSQALDRIMSSAEQQPDLQADQNFRTLQAQLKDAEAGLNTECLNLAKAIEEYDTYVRKFPNNLLVHLLGFGSMSR